MSKATRIKVEDHSGEYWVIDYKNAPDLADPVALAPNELNLGYTGINPIRMPLGWTPSYIGAGGAIYSKFVDGIECEMTQAEKDEVDQRVVDALSTIKQSALDLARNDHGFRLCIRLMRLIAGGRPTDQEVIDEGKKEFGL